MSITWTVWIARAGKQYRNECCQVQKQFQIKQSGKQHLRVLSNSNNEQCVSCGPTNSHLFILTCLSPFRFNQNILKARYTVRQTDRHTDRSTKRQNGRKKALFIIMEHRKKQEITGKAKDTGIRQMGRGKIVLSQVKSEKFFMSSKSSEGRRRKEMNGN